jgi:hypothetical protein
MPTATYDKIEAKTLGSATGSLTFSTIPATYTDLVLIANYTTTTANLDVRFQVNGDTGSNYSNTYLLGNGSSAGSGRSSNATYVGEYFSVGTSTNGNISILNVMNYANTTTNKTILHRVSSAEKELSANVALWRSTSAITSITLFTNTSSFTAGSTFTLYGIKAA